MIAVAAALVVLSVLGTAAEAARPLVDGEWTAGWPPPAAAARRRPSWRR